MQFINRGQAYVETAVFLPIFLLILFGIIWAVQTSVVNERLQFAVRYSGLISNTASPYSAWSLYSLYENALYPASATQATRTCTAPQPGVLSNASPFPGPTSAPFWQPASVSTPQCTPTRYGDSSLDEPALYNEMASSISASAAVPSFLTMGTSATTMTAQEIFLGSPDFASMITCYKGWGQNITNSLGNGTQGSISDSVAPPILSDLGGSGTLSLTC